MALSQSEIETRISTLQEGLVKVQAGVTFADRGVTYRSVDDILSAIDYWRSQLASAVSRPKQTMLVASKGF